VKPTLVILAAGIASRYGSMKQIQGFGPGGETIMDYSIYDAIRSGFGKVVFIIRKNFADDFRKVIEPNLKGRIALEYVYQEMDSFTEGTAVPPERKKPWGTAHAVLCAREFVKEPFAVINADDFYGRDTFEKSYIFLTTQHDDKLYALIGYELLKTLSDYGTVNRGICKVDKNDNLISVIERLNISRKGNVIICDDGKEPAELSLDTKSSMNFWCFYPSIFEYTQKMFREFLKENLQDIKSEFFIPLVADRFIREGGIIKVIPTSSSWFGVTYKEDAPEVEKSLLELVRNGEYPPRLWT
jgi:UTP-glucose-1-phosphate uridylyltransferase